MNQDVAGVVPQLGLALVADGMGGHDHGEIASRTAAEVCEQSFARLGGPGMNAEEAAELLQRSFLEANERIAQHPSSGEGGRASMGTTLVAAVFAHGHAIIANVGDSRCYRLHEGSFEVLTQDHSYAAQLREASAVATAEVWELAGEWAHVLSRCLNGEKGVTADMRIVRCEPGDVYLLCSDGLWGCVSDESISTLLESIPDAEAACERLVMAAREGGGPDNIGVAVVRVMSAPRTES